MRDDQERQSEVIVAHDMKELVLFEFEQFLHTLNWPYNCLRKIRFLRASRDAVKRALRQLEYKVLQGEKYVEETWTDEDGIHTKLKGCKNGLKGFYCAVSCEQLRFSPPGLLADDKHWTEVSLVPGRSPEMYITVVNEKELRQCRYPEFPKDRELSSVLHKLEMNLKGNVVSVSAPADSVDRDRLDGTFGLVS